MIAPLISLAARLGVPEPLRKLAAIGGLLVGAALLGLGAWGAWSLWLSSHDKAVIRTDRAEANAETAETVIAADRAAGAAKDRRDRDFAQEQEDLKEEADAAASSGTSPLDAVLDRLR